MSVLIAVLAVVEVGSAVGIRAAVLYAVQLHAAALTELWQLPLLKNLLLLGERRFVGLESLWILICHKVAFGRAVGGFIHTMLLQPTWCQLLSEEIGNLCITRLGMIMDVQLASKVKPCMFVEIDVTLHTDKANAYSTSFL